MEQRSRERIITLDVYTDGSLKKLGRLSTFGGWAFIVTRDNELIYRMANSEHDTTNQRMELKAILEALKYVSTIRRSNEKVVIYSDSAYAINCILHGRQMGGVIVVINQQLIKIYGWKLFHILIIFGIHLKKSKDTQECIGMKNAISWHNSWQNN